MFAWGWEMSEGAIVEEQESEGLWNDVLLVNGNEKAEIWPRVVGLLIDREYLLSAEFSIEASIYPAFLGPILDQTLRRNVRVLLSQVC
jgi:hypothetical protein